MRIIIALICLAFAGGNLNGHAQNDFRNLAWGMTIQEIKKIETAPLTREEKNSVGYRNGQEYFDGINLVYENVTVAGKNANIIYECKNGKLLKARVLYRAALYGYDGEISDIIRGFKDLYITLGNRGFKYTQPLQCGNHVYEGPDYKNEDNTKIRQMSSWNIDDKKLELVEKMIQEKHYKAAYFRIENERTRGTVMFLSKYSEWQKKTPVILELAPNYDLEAKIKTTDF